MTLLHYTMRRSRRVRRFRIAIQPGGQVVVTMPWYGSARMAARLVEQKRDWIMSHQRRLSAVRPWLPVPDTRTSYLRYRDRARQLVERRVAHFQRQYPYPYHHISIRNQRTRWGSCSRKQNLNFNYKIAFLPPHLADYIIVHELCHLQEFNHSPRFWVLVGRVMPDYAAARASLRQLSIGML